jgi:hypothetical protein
MIQCVTFNKFSLFAPRLKATKKMEKIKILVEQKEF